MKHWIGVLSVIALLLASPVFAQEKFVTATLQDAVEATGNGTLMAVDRYDAIALEVTIATTATVTFEGSVDGTTYASRTCTSIANTSGTQVTSATATGTYQCNVAGLMYFRARVSAWTSGAVTVFARATTAVLAGGGGGGGGGTQYAEDAAHTSGDTGTMSLCVRRDANTTLADTTGDYAPCQVDSGGNLKVAIISGGGTGGTSLAEDAAHASGENITPLGCRRIDTAATSAGTSGDWATVDCDANGAVRVRIDSTAVGATSADDDGSVASGTTSMSESLSRNYTYSGSAWVRELNVCDPRNTSQVAVAVSASGNTELVALTAAQTIYICDVQLVSAGTVAAQLIYGTGTACATGETDMSGPMDFVANSGFGQSPLGRLKTAEANALCIELSGAVAVNGYITYRKAATF